MRLLGLQFYAGIGGRHLFAQTFPFFFHLRSRDILFAEFVEISYGFVGGFLGVCQDCIGLLIGFLKDTVSLFFEFFLFLFCFCLQAFQFAFISGDLVLFLLESLFAGLKIRKKVFERFVLFSQVCPGFFDDIIRKPQFSRDGKCIALSGNSDEQAVSRPQRLEIELTAGVLYSGSSQGVDFKLTVMSRGHRADSPLMQMA